MFKTLIVTYLKHMFETLSNSELIVNLNLKKKCFIIKFVICIIDFLEDLAIGM